MPGHGPGIGAEIRVSAGQGGGEDFRPLLAAPEGVIDPFPQEGVHQSGGIAHPQDPPGGIGDGLSVIAGYAVSL
jgi:hypothetical protein